MRAQMNDRHVVARGSEREPAAERKIEQFRLTPGFENKRAETRTGEPFAGSAQCIFDMRRAKEKNARRIGAELEQAAGENLSSLKTSEILPNPEKRFPRRGPERQHERKAGSGRFVAGLTGKHLMQRTAPDPTRQHRIGRGVP